MAWTRKRNYIYISVDIENELIISDALNRQRHKINNVLLLDTIRHTTQMIKT